MPLGPPRFREVKTVYQPAIKPGQLLGKLTTYVNNQPSSVVAFNCTGVNLAHRIQRCWDNTNKPDKNRNGRGVRTYRTGGNFTVVDVDVNPNVLFGPVVCSNLGKPGVTQANRKEYRGFFMPAILDEGSTVLANYGTAGGLVIANNPFVPPITNQHESDAWNIRPKLEKYSAANAIFELRELPALLEQNSRSLREIWSSMTGNPGGYNMGPSKVADEYLAVQFGWKPFLGDVSKMIDTVVFYKQYLDDLIAQNNTWVRKKRTLEEEEVGTTISVFPSPGLQPFGEGLLQMCRTDENGTVGERALLKTVKRKVWAVGEFKFYRPEFDPVNEDFFSALMTVRRHMILHGLRINPSHIWQAIPWSWLIDWFSNLGDLIERLDEQYNDGMVSRYLYVMQSQSISWKSFHSYNFYSGPLQVTNERVAVTKQRRHADSPYGFVLGGSLSPTQWSILGALGLTRNVSFTRT